MSVFSPKGRAALAYAARRWHVFPCYWMECGGCSCGRTCKRPAKHPMTLDGFKSATTDPDQISRWWTECPEANIGIATGQVSGIWILDLDGPEGVAALAELEAKHGRLPATLTAITGGGGKHLYFQLPPGEVIPSRVKIAGLPIDTRGEGGYVIAPPSDHASGDPYHWEEVR